MEMICPRLTLMYRVYDSLIKDRTSYLHTTGWLHSLEKNSPITENGSPLPWLNYPLVELLEERLTRDHSVFEYGSGFSTLFYAQRVRRIVSVEHDSNWFDKLQSTVPDNVKLIHCPLDEDGSYCRTVIHHGQFNLVIVDGRDRVNCVRQALQALSPDGILILDDASRIQYQPAIDYMIAAGFRKLCFSGLKAAGTRKDSSIIFYRTNNCLEI